MSPLRKNRLSSAAFRASTWLAIALLFASQACATRTAAPPNPADLERSSLEESYAAAVSDAIVAEPSEVFPRLTAIRRDNERLEWAEIEGEARLAVVSWVSNSSYYEDRPGGVYPTGDREIWVTAVPEIQNRCSIPDFAGSDLGLRISQLLGLPPGSRPTFVEFWVRPADLFRPCPDRGIDDSTCDLHLSEGVSEEHRRWFQELQAVQYVGTAQRRAYPWTRLGYTYDWHPAGGGGSHVGLSEFVIRRDASLVVRAIVPTADYCKSAGASR